MAMDDFYTEMVERNIGVLYPDEQARLRKACIAVTGCGGMGGLAAEQLVRLGVEHVKISDFDRFEVHNISRQAGSASSNIGRKKTEILAGYFKDINPELRLDVFGEGVKPGNLDKFIEGAEIIIDGMDYSSLETSVLLYKAAKKNKLCVINPNAVGFGVSVFVFGPDTVSLDEYLGLGANKEPRSALVKLVPYMPSYADLNVFRRAAAGEIPIPNIIMPQHLGTAIAVSEAVMILLGRVRPPRGPDPRIFIVDLQDRKFEVTG